MALQLPHSHFFHVPKTGGTWVRKAIKNAGIPTNEAIARLNGETHPAQIVHCTPRDVVSQGRFSFAFVRHPLRFYQSYWCFKMVDSSHRNAFDTVCLRDDFPTFVEIVLKLRPGWVSKMYQRYVGPRCDLVDFIGRQERLADDLTVALRRAGEEFDEELLRATPPQNVVSARDEWHRRCRFPPSFLAEVVETESWAMTTFGYTVEEFRTQPHTAALPAA